MTDNRNRVAIRDSGIWIAYTKRRYTILFYALLFTLVLLPIIKTIGLPTVLVKLLLGGSLLAAVMPNATRRTRVFLFVGFLLLAGFQYAAEAAYVPVHSGLATALFGIVGLAAAAGALRFAVSSRRVNHEVVYAALGTYLLAGLFFGQIYWSLEGLETGSITGPDPLTEQSAVYYSFVTLATLGYGDFLPRTDVARGVATLEVIGGQLFLAVMVARLIGAFGFERDVS